MPTGFTSTLPEEEFLTEEEPQTARPQIQEQVEEQEPQPVPESPIRPLALARADLEKQLAGFKALVAELESTEGRLARAEVEEGEILDGSGLELTEEEQLEKLSRTLALKKVLERKLERGNSSGLAGASAKLEHAVKEALRSLWQDRRYAGLRSCLCAARPRHAGARGRLFRQLFYR